MRPDVYERVRRELLDGLDEVYLSGTGEPFVAPVFYEMLDDMLKGGKRVWVVTNGTIIRPEYIERLVRSPSLLIVSIDGTTPQTMERMRPGARLDRVIEFMKTVKEIMDRGKHPRFEFNIGYVATRFNVEQMTDCVELAHRYGVHTLSFTNFETYQRPDEFARESLMSCPELVLPHWERAHKRGLELGVLVPPIVFRCQERSQEEQARYQSNLFSPSGRIRQCPLPWWSTYIDTDGLVRPCCFFPPEMALGNLREQSFRAIWNGPKYRELRRTVNTPQMPERCRQCTMQVRI